MFPSEMHKIGGQMISAPTNLVSVNCVGTGVLDRPLTQQHLRTVREAGPYEHREGFNEIKQPDKPEFIRMFNFLYRIRYCF